MSESPDRDFAEEHPEEKDSDEKHASFKTFHTDLYRDLSDLNRQVRMISDSLAACKQMSRRKQVYHRQSKTSGTSTPRKSDALAIRTTVDALTRPQTPAQILLPPEERTQEFTCGSDQRTTVVSYLMEERSPMTYLRPVLAANFSRKGDVACLDAWDEDRWGAEWKAGMHDVRESPSLVRLYDAKEVDHKKMLQVIERELRTLMKIAPSVSMTLIQLSDIVFHYKECSKCCWKFRGFLPEFLNRIQNLIKFVTNKKGKNYIWPNDQSLLRLSQDSKPLQLVEQDEEIVSEVFELGRLRKVDALSRILPGVQLHLLVKPERGRKRLFETLSRKKVERELPPDKNKVLLILNCHELPYSLNLRVLKATPQRRVHWQQKQEVRLASGVALAVPFVSANPKAEAFEAAIGVPQANTLFIEYTQVVSYPTEVAPFEERVLVHTLHYAKFWLLKVGVPEEAFLKSLSYNGLGRMTSISFRSNASSLMRFLEEAEEEDMMEVQKVKDLEDEVRSLKDLMMEVHKNQIELSKVLLEKGVYSQPIIKLTDPKMLEEETRAVRIAAQMEMPQRSSSAEALQVAVDELKKKCTIKNRMIVTLLKGLRSNVPKEWWEELVDCIFNESKPIEEFDIERVNEFIRQTSLYLVNCEKASIARKLPGPVQDVTSEEKEVCLPSLSSTPTVNDSAAEEARGKAGVDLGAWRNSKEDFSQKISCWPESGEHILGDPHVQVIALPASTSGTTEYALRKLENQVALLILENDRLWHQINEIRDQMNQTRAGSSSGGGSSSSNSKKPKHETELESSPEVIKSSAKSINLFIQIGDKGKKLIRNGSKVDPTPEIHGTLKGLSLMPKAATMSHSSSQDPVSRLPDEVDSRFRVQHKVDLIRSICFDENDERPRAFPKGKVRRNTEEARIPPARAPGPSDLNANDTHHPGPSTSLLWTRPDTWNIQEKSSRTRLVETQHPAMVAMMANERQLQTIPENEQPDCVAGSTNPGTVAQVMQRLKTRTRPPPKDLTPFDSGCWRLEKRQAFQNAEPDLSALNDKLE